MKIKTFIKSRIIYKRKTTKYDKNIDRYECAADFKMIGNANTTTLPITYTVESTDKKGEFYVTVDGF